MEQPASASSSQEKRSTDRAIDEVVRVHSRLVLLLVAGGRGGDGVHGSAACVSLLEEVEGRIHGTVTEATRAEWGGPWDYGRLSDRPVLEREESEECFCRIF
jgi:hypothetical protein